MAKNDVNLKIGADTKAALKSVKGFAASAAGSLKKVSGSFALLGGAAAGIAGFFAGRALLNGIKDVTAAAVVQEDAIKRMTTALTLAGDFSEAASQDMQQFASDLQNVTTTGDETTLEMLALAKSFGTTNEQAKALVKTATDLSATTGKALETEVRNLGKTYSGVAGKLAEMSVEVKGLTKTQLESGEAIAILGKRFEGAAAAMADTFGGATTQTTNIIGDFKEELGFLITTNPIVIGGIKALGKAFLAIIDNIKKNREGIQDLIKKGFLGMVKAIPSVIKGIGLIVKAVNKLTTGFLNLRGWASEADNSLYTLIQNVAGYVGNDELANWAKNAADDAKKLAEEYRKDAKDAEKFFTGVEKGVDSLASAMEDAIDGIQEIKEEIPDGNIISVVGDPSAWQRLKKFVKDFAGDLKTAVKNAFIDPKTGEIITKSVVLASAGLAKGILTGAKGAQELITKGIGAAADVLLPGIGGAVGEIAGLLAQGPEKVKEMVTQFAEALPDIIVAIIEGLAAAAGTIITALVDSLLINGGLERIIKALISSMPRVGIAIGHSLLKAIRDGVTAFFRHLGSVFQIKTPKWVQDLIDALSFSQKSAIGGKGKGGLEKALGVDIPGVHLAKGGITAYRGGSGIDTIPAMVSSGEITVDRSTTDKLKTFLDNPNSGTSDLLLAKIIDLLSRPMNVQTSAEINGDTFANIVLELDRNNARLTA